MSGAENETIRPPTLFMSDNNPLDLDKKVRELRLWFNAPPDTV